MKEMKKEIKNEMNTGRTIKSISSEYLQESLELIERVFKVQYDEAEGKQVRRLVEEIRSKKYYLPELEVITLDDAENVIGYVMFSRFHLNGNYEDKLLILTPAAVEQKYQRQHICKEMIEFAFEKAIATGFEAVLVEGDPANYRARGFQTAADYGILPGETVHLPHIACLMVKELVPGALERIKGTVEYDFYETLMEEG